jgi:RimJ/RimL family protein N-acetyltransferase
MIETDRLLLRRFRETDRAAFAAIVADPEVADWLGGARVQAPAYFDTMGAFWAEHGYGALGIERKADGAVVGRVGLRRVPMAWRHPMSGEVEVGWMLARPAWGHGYASEAAAAMLPWGFETLNVPVIHSWTAAGNHRSQAVMRRIGMTRAAHLDFDQPDTPPDDPLHRVVVYLTARPAK